MKPQPQIDMQNLFDRIAEILQGYNPDEGGLPVFHSRHHPCANTSGDIAFELSDELHSLVSELFERYSALNDFPGDKGELDFWFHTMFNRNELSLAPHLYVVQVTEVEKMDKCEIRDFVYHEITSAIEYLREYFCPPENAADEMEEEGLIRLGED